MNSLPATPWIHIGECPVCVNGLCRIRACQDQQGSTHLYAMCDECEAMWIEPSTDTKKVFPAAEEPTCPICSQPLFGPQARWALPEDVSSNEAWSLAAIFELPSGLEAESDMLVIEDIATDLDAPPALPLFAEPDPQAPASELSVADELMIDATDCSYGQDDPKPGC